MYHEDLICNAKKAVWIPEEEGMLQLRICIIAHTTATGHRGEKSAVMAVSKEFLWSTLKEDVKTFCRTCIHCLAIKGGVRVPPRYGPAFHGTKANDLLQFDYLEMGPSFTGAKNLLMFRDDFSPYVWLFPFAEADAKNSAEAILDWCSSFTPPNALMSDG